jgi:hypothetical protein
MMQSIALPKECEKIVDTLPPGKKKQLEDPKNLEDIKNLLTSPNPAWLIGFDTTVIAANLPALWLWDVLPEVLQSKKLPDGLRTFNIFARNFDRIPLEENKDFYWKKSIDAEAIKAFCRDEEPIRKFKQKMLADPQRKAIYKEAREALAEALAKEKDILETFDFKLKIRPPQEPTSPEFLQFQVSAALQLHGRRLIGWRTVYNPLGEELSIIKREYEQLLTKYYEYNSYDTIPYVITDIGALYDVRIAEIIKGEEGGGAWLREAHKRIFSKEAQEKIEAYAEEHKSKVKRQNDMSPEELEKELKDLPFVTPKEARKWRGGLPRI